MPRQGLKLFGYNRGQVHKHLQDLGARHARELLALSQKLETVRQETASLSRELAEVRAKSGERDPAREMAHIALERSSEIAGLLAAWAREEIQNIRRRTDRTIAACEAERAGIEDRINGARVQIASMLNHVLQSVEDRGAGPLETAPAKVVGTILSTSSKSESLISALGGHLTTAGSERRDLTGMVVISVNGTSLGRVARLAVNQDTGEITGLHLQDSQEKAGWFIPADDVVAMKKDVLVVAARWSKPSVAAEGSPVPVSSTANCLNEVANLGEGCQQGTAHVSSHGPDHGKGEKGFAGNPGGYWGLVDVAWEKVAARAEMALAAGSEETMAPPAFNGINAVALAAGSGTDMGLDMDTGWATTRAAEGILYPLMSSEYWADGVSPAEAGPEPSSREHLQLSVSPGPATGPAGNSYENPAGDPGDIERNGEDISYKYLAGKLAGQDLVDSQGQMIIARRGVIIPEVVDRARKEGKLAELIVYMITPDMDE